MVSVCTSCRCCYHCDLYLKASATTSACSCSPPGSRDVPRCVLAYSCVLVCCNSPGERKLPKLSSDNQTHKWQQRQWPTATSTVWGCEPSSGWQLDASSARV